jgi:hypothetical protein
MGLEFFVLSVSKDMTFFSLTGELKKNPFLIL